MTPEVSRSPRNHAPLALSILLVHVFLDGCFGQLYAKAKIPLGVVDLYPTDLVLLTSLLVGARAIASVPWDRTTKLVSLFIAIGAGWAGLAGLGGMESAGTKAFSFFIYALFYFLVRGGVRTDEDRWRLLRAVSTSSVVAVAIGLWQMQTGTPVLTSVFEETTTGSIRWLPGEFALYALLAITVSAVEPIVRRRFDRGGLLLLAAGAAELVLAQHRSGFVALAVSLAATALFLTGSSRALKGLVKVAIVVALGVTLVMWLFGSGYIDETMSRIATTGDTSDVNIQWRLLAWYEVGDGILARPFGHGFAVWDFLFTAQDPLTGSHNSFLDLTYRVGVPGLLVFLALPVRMFASARRNVQRYGVAAELLPITVCACLLALLAYASFNVVLETPYMSVFFWILMGIGTGALDDRDRPAPPAPTPDPATSPEVR